MSKEIIQLQAPLKPEQSGPVTLNVNVNFCTPTQTVVPAVSHTTIVDPLTHGAVKNIDISDMIENIEDKQASALVSAINTLQIRQSAWQQNGIRKEKSIFLTA